MIQQSGMCQAQSSSWKNERSILNESCLESTYGRKDSLTTHLGNQSSRDTDQKAFDSINTEILCQLFPLFKGTQVYYFPKRQKRFKFHSNIKVLQSLFIFSLQQATLFKKARRIICKTLGRINPHCRWEHHRISFFASVPRFFFCCRTPPLLPPSPNYSTFDHHVSGDHIG